jgi:hypothetical protein
MIAELLHPFLKSLAAIQSKEIKERLMENIFRPLLENNKTIPEPTSSDEEEMIKKDHYHRHVDGGKMNPRTVREIQNMLD